MHLLLTRPEAQSREMQRLLTERGINSSIAPMIDVTLLPVTRDRFNGITGLVVTSRNAVRSLAASGFLDKLDRIPVYAVGPGTERQARDAGFRTVITSSGTAEDLCALVSRRESAQTAHLSYVAGEDVAYDCATHLSKAGFQIGKVTAYRSSPAKVLPASVQSALQNGEIDGVVLMSPLAARTYARLIEESGLSPSLRSPRLFCLSQKVAAAVSASPDRIEIAKQPNTEEMLALITRFAPK